MGRWRWLALIPLALLLALYITTFPPLLPSHARVVAAWHPSESWLYDRGGALIDSERVDFKARRLGWVKLADIAPVVGETVIAAEDKRFRSHGGVDWLAVGNAVRSRFGGAKSRGASTISMQVAAFLSPDLEIGRAHV